MSPRRKPKHPLATGISTVVAFGAVFTLIYITFFPAQALTLTDKWGVTPYIPALSDRTAPPTPAATTPPATTPSTPTSTGTIALDEARVQEARDVLTSLDVQERPYIPGYERGCSPDELCVFGPAWTDDNDGPGGHNGCDTRNDLLQATMSNPQFKDGGHCVVLSGTYVEPYFGTTEDFVRGEPTATQDEVDHVYPLALGWDMGMSTRDIEERKAFANDLEVNLAITTRAANGSGYDTNDDGNYDLDLGEHPPKSDMTAGEWLPWLTNPAAACNYAARYALTANRYDLPITPLDKTEITKAFEGCS